MFLNSKWRLKFCLIQGLKMGPLTNSPGLWALLQILWRRSSWCIWQPLSFRHHFHHWEKTDKNTHPWSGSQPGPSLWQNKQKQKKQASRKVFSNKCTAVAEKGKSVPGWGHLADVYERRQRALWTKVLITIASRRDNEAFDVPKNGEHA